MGACGISISFTASDWKKTFNEIHKEAEERYTGRYCEDAAYSGDWNTVSISGSVIKVSDKYSESKTKSWLNKNMDKLWDSIPKRSGRVIDCGITGYEVWSVKKVTPKDKKTPKYETKFVVFHMGGTYGHEEIVDATCKTATEANTKAMKLTMENDRYYHVKKTRVLISGNEETATFQLVKKSYKSKPKSVKAGSTLKELHKYYVVGIAAE